MASTYSTNLAIELIGTGDQAGTWGTTTNSNLGTLIEQAISGYVTQAVSTGTDTTITIPNGATGVARNMYIELTGTGGASTNLIVPANKKLYFIFNNTSSGQVTVKVSGQTGVSVPNKAKMILVSNGTDIVDATNYIGNISAASANITVLTSASATITNLIATSASITTLTNNPTFSAGTANGVLFLNGSKVATSGSALVFNGTALGVTNGQITQQGAVSTGGANATILANGSGQAQLWATGADASTLGSWNLVIARSDLSSSIEVLKCDTSGNLIASGNLGIGTASPGTKLDVATSSGDCIIRLGNGTSQARFAVDSDGPYIYPLTSGDLSLRVFTPAGGTAATIDTSGNLGLGVTPSVWIDYKALQTTGASFIGYSDGASNNQAQVVANAYFTTGSAWKYIYTDHASRYMQYDGEHRWYNAPSGTAGNAITFTQAMTLTAAGKLGIGVTSPSGLLDVRGAAPFMYIVDSAGANQAAFVAEATNTVVNVGSTYLGTAAVPLALVTGGTERARITSGGNFQLTSGGQIELNVSTLSSKGAIAAFNVDSTSGGLVFKTESSSTLTERGRFTAGGYFKASNDGNYTGATNAYHEFYQTANNIGLYIRSTNASYTATVLECSGDRTTTNTSYYLFDVYNGNFSGRFRVADSGNATNTNGSYGTISDAKMKTDIVDAGSQWDDIKAVRFRKFKMKDDPSGLMQLGVVAQELEQTSPGLVDEHADRDADGNDLGTTTKSVKSSILLMKAAVALQEAMARIEQLEADMAALKASA